MDFKLNQTYSIAWGLKIANELLHQIVLRSVALPKPLGSTRQGDDEIGHGE